MMHAVCRLHDFSTPCSWYSLSQAKTIEQLFAVLKPHTPPRVNIDVLFAIAFEHVGALDELDERRSAHSDGVLARIAVISRRQAIAELHRSIWPGSYEQLQVIHPATYSMTDNSRLTPYTIQHAALEMRDTTYQLHLAAVVLQHVYKRVRSLA